MISLVRIVNSLANPHAVDIGVNYLLNVDSEIRYRTTPSSLLNTGSKEQYIITYDYQCVGYMTAFVKKHKGINYYLIETFEICYPCRGYGYTRDIMAYLEQNKGNIIITRPVSLNHWISVLGIAWWKKKVKSMNIADFLYLTSLSEIGDEILNHRQAAFLRQLSYDDSNYLSWKTYIDMSKYDIPIRVVKWEDVDEIGMTVYIEHDNVIIGKLMYNGCFMPLGLREIESISHRYGYEYHHEYKDKMEGYPQIDRKVKLVTFMRNMDYSLRNIKGDGNMLDYNIDELEIDYRNIVWYHDSIVGMLLADSIRPLTKRELEVNLA